MSRPKASSVRIPTPKRLLDAAEVEFGKRGLVAARLEDIAARAGITRPSLLHHFSSKPALYEAVVRRAFSDLAEALGAPVPAARTVEKRLLGLVATFARFVSRRPGLAAIILREFLDGTGSGRRILLGGIDSVLKRVELIVDTQGRHRLRPGLPLRQAVLQTAADILLREVAGPLRVPLWGRRDRSMKLATKLYIEDTA